MNYLLGDVIHGGVCLANCPVVGTPQLHCINRLELVFENVMYLARGDHPNSWKNAPRMEGQMKIFHVGSRQFRESLRELLREFWFSYCKKVLQNRGKQRQKDKWYPLHACVRGGGFRHFSGIFRAFFMVQNSAMENAWKKPLIQKSGYFQRDIRLFSSPKDPSVLFLVRSPTPWCFATP